MADDRTRDDEQRRRLEEKKHDTTKYLGGRRQSRGQAGGNFIFCSLTNWASALKKATEVYNEKSHAYLMGSAPSDVEGSDELQYELDKVHGEQIKHNNEKWLSSLGELRDAGTFRIPLAGDTWERVDAPKFGGEVYGVDTFKEQISSLVINHFQSKHPLLCLLEALTLALVSNQDREQGDESDSERCFKTMP